MFSAHRERGFFSEPLLGRILDSGISSVDEWCTARRESFDSAPFEIWLKEFPLAAAEPSICLLYLYFGQEYSIFQLG